MNKKGFTLIEVLTVIMIIAILASIVLVSLEAARNRTKDVTIQQQLSQLRSLAESLYTFEDGYEDFTVTTHTENSKFLLVKEKIDDMGGEIEGNIHFSDDGQEYCAYSFLVRDTNKAFCVDSTGNAVVLEGGDEGDLSCTGDNFTCEIESGGNGGF
jgi:prepilin-type N-terminal cleavage/methylation domain-containing protein